MHISRFWKHVTVCIFDHPYSVPYSPLPRSLLLPPINWIKWHTWHVTKDWKENSLSLAETKKARLVIRAVSRNLISASSPRALSLGTGGGGSGTGGNGASASPALSPILVNGKQLPSTGMSLGASATSRRWTKCSNYSDEGQWRSLRILEHGHDSNNILRRLPEPFWNFELIVDSCKSFMPS